MRCPNCNAIVEKGDQYCQECGFPLDSYSKKRKTNPVVITTIAFLISVCVFCLIIFAMARIKNDESSTDTTTESASHTTVEVTNTPTPTSSFIPTLTPTETINPVTPTETPMASPTIVYGNDGAEYVIADSASRYLTDVDVAGLSIQQLNYAKNEIYARHGRRFSSQELQNYFNSRSWYVGMYDPSDFDQNLSSSVLNDYEKKNAEFLRDKEYAINPNGYQLDVN